MSVAIIGAGMTGLLAAKACMDKGIMPTILSATKPNPGHGVRYLHDNCGLPLKPIEIETAFVGYGDKFMRWNKADQRAMAELYAIKTGASQTNNSIHRSVKTVTAYNWMDAWNMLQGLRIIESEVLPDDMRGLSRKFDLVINTAPLNKIYPHSKSQCLYREMYVSDCSPYPNHDSWASTPDNIIVYNVDIDAPWTRYSRVDGVEQTEYIRPVEGAHKVIKVDGKAKFYNHQQNVLLLGRYGKWDSTYMAHMAYYDTMSRLEKIGLGK